MKLLSFLGACALAALAAQPVAADSGKGKPGYCDDDKDCYDKNYACVSVQTTRDGVENVKQCLRVNGQTPICTGVVPGLCPSFSTTWGSSFRQISSVCAYIYPQGKNIKCIKPGEESSKGAVECLFVQDPEDPTNTTATVGVIYGCVDFDGSRLLFKKNDKSDKLASQYNYSEIIEDSCVNPKNPSGSTFVCSSQGTCAPNSANSMEYSCKCNIGFSGKYCEKIVNNQCYNDGVCGGGSCDLANNVCTKCPAGTTGNKCAYCDPTYDETKVCSKHGKCVPVGSASNSSARMLASTEYQCQCNAGYSDTHCAVKVKTPSSANQTPAPASTNSLATSVKVSISAALIVAVAAFTA